jgi:hypothetical protein
MSELVAPSELPNPLTGELVNASDPAAVAEALDGLREHKWQVQTAISLFERAAADVAEKAGTRTLRAGGFKLEVSGGREIDWDVETLEADLEAAGLPQERLRELVTYEQVVKVNAAVAKQIEAANPAYAEIVVRCRRYVPKATRVKVSRG